MTTTNLLLVFIAFLAGQLFNAVCSGLAHPQAVNIVVLLVHDLAIAGIVWWLFSTRRNKKSSSPSTTLLPYRLPLLLLPPKPLLLLPPPAGPNPRLVIRLSIPRWMISLRVYFAPRPQRALMAHQGNRLIVGIVWQALAAIKAHKLEKMQVVKHEYPWRSIPRPLGFRGIHLGPVFRLSPSLLAPQDISRILDLVGTTLLGLRTSTILKTVAWTLQDDSVTLVNESPSASFVEEKVSMLKSPPATRSSRLALVGHLAAAAMSRKAANPVVHQSSPPPNPAPPPYVQEEKTYRLAPPTRPSLVSLLEQIPFDLLHERFSRPTQREQPEEMHAFIEEVEDEHDDEGSLSGDSDDAELFSYEAFADDIQNGALFDLPSGPSLPTFAISRPPSLSNIAARFTTSRSRPSTSRMAMLARLRHLASTCA
ncbi:hypothetical protein FB45DRAFT_942217 [Roridomyces roridus]|uniref:Uncharacterized protein n=1 Tax=Roridomyces roridus TaxID=1738132 RepID=A0AAD7FCM2_9AGAR|nr:hypothetical protein FB45DRAFT_942217 [Roridomyces roridus]